MLFDSGNDAIKRGLSLSTLRHEIIADNIANVSTPSYRRKDVSFKGMMQDRMSGDLSLSVTDRRHIGFSSENINKNLFINYPQDTIVNANDNNVEMDTEVVNMSGNIGYYNALATIINKKFKITKDVISGRGA
ncbi:MAG: flagellar basal-body rod protein FlgB [Candidatus Margulisbacteria bacterium GWF2_35_9]|nr:MAG: flagellar basal-body rod protein FlgB [Candidatus Margulisbacteria bacterium GWF2_35_9]